MMASYSIGVSRPRPAWRRRRWYVRSIQVTIALSVGIAAMVTHEFNNHGIRNTVHVDSPWGQ